MVEMPRFLRGNAPSGSLARFACRSPHGGDAGSSHSVVLDHPIRYAHAHVQANPPASSQPDLTKKMRTPRGAYFFGGDAGSRTRVQRFNL